MNKLGLYIHIPFCLQKCKYCDFYSLAGSLDFAKEYVKALEKQIVTLAPDCRDHEVDSVYIGGGTPSVLPSEMIGSLLECIFEHYNLSAHREITIEANPATVTPEALALYLKHGINRISFGVQTFENETLSRIGRLHTFEDACASVRMARGAGFENISADLMFALPGQKKDEVENAFRALVPLGVTHISLYGLKVEENTPFGRDPSLVLPGEDEQCDLYLSSVKTFEDCGFMQYEISNFALPGFESRHNMRYWQREEYLGFGPGAHSFFKDIRFEIPRSITRYMACSDFSLLSELYINRSLIAEREAFEEEIMLSLRTVKGLRAACLSHIPQISELIDRYEKAGLLLIKEGRIVLTPEGMLVSNDIISEILLLNDFQ